MTTQSSWIGKTLGGRYEIQELLGQGGMSAVYKANDPNLRRVVAIKLIHQHLSSNPEFVRRFEEEAAAVAQLRHPNLIQVFDFTHDQEVYFIVFEFVPGETLQGRMRRLAKQDRTMELGEAIEVAAKTADGLNYAHNKGLIHRDIKPANIMLNVYGEPILMDFGIAKIMGGTQHTATGAVLGTARYMSPEQIKGERIDPRTDIYSLGVTLFEMLGGRPPFEADSAMTLMMMHMTDPVPDLRKIREDVPPGLVAVVNKALEKEPANRYKSAAELAAALRGALDAPGPAVSAGATTIESAPLVDPGATVLEPSAAAGLTDPAPSGTVDTAAATAAAAAAAGATVVDTSAGSTAPSQTTPVATTPPPPPPPVGTASTATGGGGNRNLLIGIAAVVAVVVIGLGLWFAFRPSDDGGLADNGNNAGDVPGVVDPTEVPTESPAATDEPAPTDEPDPTDTPEPTPTEEIVVEEAVGPDAVSGDVLLVTDAGDAPLGPDTAVPVGSSVQTGADGEATFFLDDGSSAVDVAPETLMGFDVLAADPESIDEETIVRLEKGDALLRKASPGNALVVVDEDTNEIARLVAPATPAESAAMAVQIADDGTMRVSCFEGECQLADESFVPPSSEVWMTPEGAIAQTAPIDDVSASYVLWQDQCDDCLPVAVAAVPTEPPPTPTAAATPTTAPTATPEAPQLAVSITNIAQNESGIYVVDYTTSGYTEQLPGQHVHFYWNTISQEQAGVGPNQASWFVYGGPRPFQGWGINDKPANATAMCAIVANADHTAVMNSGNCWNLP